MSEQRVSAIDRQDQGAGIGVAGLAFAGLGWFTGSAGVVIVGLVVAIIGGIMWGAGMARSD